MSVCGVIVIVVICENVIIRVMKTQSWFVKMIHIATKEPDILQAGVVSGRTHNSVSITMGEYANVFMHVSMLTLATENPHHK